SVDWNGRREDSGGVSGTGETPQALGCRGGSPPAPRKAKRPGMESNSPHSHEYEKRLLIFHSPGLSLVS
ncbi:hypothetical protein, partial [Bacillus badius]|uniref:hypothetical protein n=1 Tax=Bacillus badius TaxID=1455 RepID=UPI001E48C60C